MKQALKFTVIIALVFFSSKILHAQNWQFGVNVDLNYATAQGNGLKNKLNMGYGGGVWPIMLLRKDSNFSQNYHWRNTIIQRVMILISIIKMM
ncbi:MAG: hypothetical protein QM763_20925 [Agriterribacter sp.]